ncbi:MAG: transcriptional regulator [Blastopirellula sp.]|nr:MAG: transcriptional regulator [Blastopirellula sp.]
MSQEETTSRILEAAGQVFADRGFKAATIRDICSKADVNLASVNYHFGDKQRLYIATIKHAHQLPSSQFPIPQWHAETSPETKLADFIQVTLSRMIPKGKAPWQAKLMMREMTQPTLAVQELIKEYIRPHFDLLLSILRQLVAKQTSEQQLTKLGFSIIGQCLFYRFNQPVLHMLVDEEMVDQHFSIEQLAQHITHFSLLAIRHFTEEPNDPSSILSTPITEQYSIGTESNTNLPEN